MKNSFTGTELLAALKTKTFDTVFAVTGIVQQGPDDYSILFCEYQDCSSWVSIPTDVILEADYQGDYTCPDGTDYPLFVLYLSIPSDNPAAAAFARLLKLGSRGSQETSCSCVTQPQRAVRARRIGQHKRSRRRIRPLDDEVSCGYEYQCNPGDPVQEVYDYGEDDADAYANAGVDMANDCGGTPYYSNPLGCSDDARALPRYKFKTHRHPTPNKQR